MRGEATRPSDGIVVSMALLVARVKGLDINPYSAFSSLVDGIVGLAHSLVQARLAPRRRPEASSPTVTESIARLDTAALLTQRSARILTTPSLTAPPAG
jgi:hypothetical protein